MAGLTRAFHNFLQRLLPKMEPLFPFADTVHREPQWEGEILIPQTENKHCIMPASQTEFGKTQTAGSREEKMNLRR